MNYQAKLLFHILGLSCLGASIFLQALVFIDILQFGYFVAGENNSVILSVEILLLFYAVGYFLYIYQHFLRSVKNGRGIVYV